MSEAHPTLCFQCGHVAGQQVRLNRLPDGSVCSTCRERLLTDLPPLLPSFGYGGAADGAEAYEDEQAESADDGRAVESDPPAGA